MADNIPAWAGDPGQVDGPGEYMLLRVESDGTLTELGEYPHDMALKLARQYSRESRPILSHLVELPWGIEEFRNGYYIGLLKYGKVS